MNEWIQQGITSFDEVPEFKNNGLLTLGFVDRRGDKHLQISHVVMTCNWLKGSRITRYKHRFKWWPQPSPRCAIHINRACFVRVIETNRWLAMFSIVVIDACILMLMVEVVNRQRFICPLKHSFNNMGAHL